MTNIFRSKQELQEIYEVCFKWLKWSVPSNNLQDVISYVNALSSFSRYVEISVDDNIANDISILIDDILEMESLSAEEKEYEIRKMLEEDKEELQNLARQVIAKLEEDFEQTKIAVKEQVKEMEARGFEEDTIKKFVENILGKEDWEE